MSTETAQPKDEPKLAFVDGRDALAYLIIRPADGGVELEAAANGIGKPDAARILRHVADQWDPQAPTGDFILIGPECFASADESVICWRGRNYVPQPEPQAAKLICAHCGLPADDAPGRRDTRHDHCGPLPHTGPVGGPYCERCG